MTELEISVIYYYLVLKDIDIISLTLLPHRYRDDSVITKLYLHQIKINSTNFTKHGL